MRAGPQARLLWVACCAWVAGCATSPWIELRSPHFVFTTTMQSEDAHRAVMELEQVYAALESYAFAYTLQPRDPMEVVLLPKKGRLADLAPQGWESLYVRPQRFEGVPVVLVHDDFDEHTLKRVIGGIVVRFAQFHFSQSSAWLVCGMAEYYATMVIEGGLMSLGDPYEGLVCRPGGSYRSCWIAPEDIPPVRTLMTMDWATYSGQALGSYDAWITYRTHNMLALALVHFLAGGPNEYRPRFSVYLDQLAAGKSEVFAWREAFGAVDEAEMDKAYYDYIRTGKVKIVGVRLPAFRRFEVRERNLSAVDVALLNVRLRPFDREFDRAEVRADIADAIEADPTAGEPYYWRARLAKAELRFEDAKSDLTTALAISPDEPRYLLERARIAFDAGEYDQVEASLPKIRKLSSTYALNFIASYYAKREQYERGLPFARRAVEGEPGCWECWDSYALLLFQRGLTSAAIEAQQRAVNLMPDDEAHPEVGARLHKYQLSAEEKKERD